MADDSRDGERPGDRPRDAFCHTSFFYHRVLLLMCAIAISVPVLYNGRPGRVNSTRAAFSVSTSSRGYVRISGDVRHAGMYPISVNLMTEAVINMADPLLPVKDGLAGVNACEKLASGTALHVAVRPDGQLQLSKSQMPANERLIMGIPLDINTMSEADFDRVPGIGPMTAKRIVEYRHNNGGMMPVSDLLAVEGIGEKKYKQLLKFF